MAVERARFGHDDHGSSDDQPAKKSQKAVSVAMNRWLDEPLAQGPFVVLGDVVGWEDRACGQQKKEEEIGLQGQ